MNYLKTILTLSKIFIFRITRDKLAIFFIFLFPLVFLLVFGSVFAGNETTFKAALINNSNTQFSKEFVKKAYEDDKVFKFDKDIKTVDDAKHALGNDKIFVAFVLDENFGKLNKDKIPSGKVTTLYTKGSESSGTTAHSIMEGILGQINISLTKSEPPLTIDANVIEQSGAKNFDYIFSGLIGFTILASCLFGVSFAIPADKKAGALKRLMASSLRPSQLLISYGGSIIVFTLLSVGMMSVVATYVFGLTMQGSWLTAGLLAFSASFMMLGLGCAVGGWAKNENQASPVANLVGFPLMFLSGSFFPRFTMPEWMQNITEYLPLTPLIDGLRKIITENATLVDLAPQLLLMAIWTVIFYTLAFKLFRWE